MNNFKHHYILDVTALLAALIKKLKISTVELTEIKGIISYEMHLKNNNIF